MVGYHVEIRDSLEAFEIATDNAFMIRSLVPWDSENRLKLRMTQETYDDVILPQFRSGVLTSPAKGPYTVQDKDAAGIRAVDRYRRGDDHR